MQYNSSSNDSLPVLAVQNVKPAAALAANSGGASRLYQTRRGSFMILVVGTLALLAVITILYVGIGRSDRQLSAATVRNENTERVPDLFKDYAAQVIADGAASIYEPTAGRSMPADQREFYRKTWDYPSTDWNLQTYITDPTDWRYFTPSGGRTGTTPFLASNDPTHLNFLVDPPVDPLGQRAYERFDDWYHISNFAPDGAFVNLYNMRIPANAGGKGFDAAPADMRKNVFLLDNTGRATMQRDFGVAINAAAGPYPYAANPADLTMRQAYLFREKRLDYVTGATVDSPDFLRYSYDDADGDGLYDVRLMELREWRDPTSPEFKSLLPQDQTYRWFFGVKCVDLSGMVNLNTATDTYYQGASPTGEPKAELPIGVVPAEVDLMRILSLYEPFDLYGKSYADFNTLLQDPANPNPPDYYQDYTDSNAVGGVGYTGQNAFTIGKVTYDWTRRAVQGSLTQRQSPDQVTGFSGFSFPTPVDRYVQYLAHAGRPGELSASGVSGSFNYSSSSGFKLADQIELMRFRGINSPEQSRLEAMIDGRPRDNPADARLSPLRSNRSLFAERDFAPHITNTITRHNLIRYQAVADVRHNLTVVSGARDLRPGPVTPEVGYVPPALSSKDLKVDVQSWLATHDVPIRLPMTANDAILLTNNRGWAEKDIFLGYANALFPPLPSGLRATAWGQQTQPAVQALRTRMYGYGTFKGTGPTACLAPELPIYASAFMAVNLIDAYDNDLSQFISTPPVDVIGDVPTVKTVLFSDRFRTNLMSDYASPPAGNNELWDPTVPQSDPKEYDVTNPTGNRAYPWAHWVDPGRLGQFDLNEGDSAKGRLYAGAIAGGPGTVPIVPAMNVYGIEAQPFITQIGAFTIYTDTPSDKGGDIDEAADADGDNIPDANITIKGDLPTNTTRDITSPGANCDVVCRGVAFQLANPFDHDITLSMGGPSAAFQFADALGSGYPEIDREKDFYYIEYANNFYKLAELRDEINPSLGTYLGKSTLRPLTIGAGESIVVYALDRTQKEVADRWKELGLQIVPGDQTRSLSGRINKWISSQFSGSFNKAWQIPRFAPLEAGAGSGKVITAFNPNPIVGAVNSDVNRFAHLWRAQRAADFPNSSARHEGAMKTDATIPANFDGTGAPQQTVIFERNSRENDRLVDRFVAPGNVEMLRKLPDGNNQIPGAPAGSEAATGIVDPNYNSNTGMTVMVWATARRPDYGMPRGSQPVGVIPPWCIEPKSDGAVVAWNSSATDGFADPTATVPADRTTMFISPGGEMSFSNWYDKTRNLAVVEQMNLAPQDRTTHDIDNGGHTHTGTGTFRETTSEIFLENNRFTHVIPPIPPATTSTTVSVMRLADVLKPFCIGPFETPVTNSGTKISQINVDPANRNGAAKQRWVTLSQAMAVAYGYDNLAAATAPSGAVLQLYLPFNSTDPARTPATITHQVQVGGHIVIDDFVPFHDVNTPANRSYNFAGGDYRTGLGVPVAMNILDNFSMATSLLTTLNKAKPGVINLNTATRTVLASVPMLSPPPLNDPGPLAQPWWWWKPDANILAPLDTHTDIAATFIAYRDKIPYQVRQSARTGALSDIRYFGDGLTRPDSPVADGRDATSSIFNIQESPGIRSMGELLAARVRVDIGGGNVLPSDPSNIDFRGHLPTPAGNESYSRIGVASILHKDPAGGNDRPSSEINSFANQVDLANAVYTSASVRSDYFAVYFTIQGYQRSDVENLGPNDPMIPSIRRRYLMIVDRSNVQRVGDKPRILAFKELPIN